MKVMMMKELEMKCEAGRKKSSGGSGRGQEGICRKVGGKAATWRDLKCR
jgi:hypothetical protein